jgi:hypothetical protein
MSIIFRGTCDCVGHAPIISTTVTRSLRGSAIRRMCDTQVTLGHLAVHELVSSEDIVAANQGLVETKQATTHLRGDRSGQ